MPSTHGLLSLILRKELGLPLLEKLIPEEFLKILYPEELPAELLEVCQEEFYHTALADSFLNGIRPISQLPELPTGCEVTSLAVALNYLGIPADKQVLADRYLEKGPVGTVDFRKSFCGDPRDPDSFGCYAPVIVKCANAYLESIGSELRAHELTGTDLTGLFAFIDAGIPVILWGTFDNTEAHPGMVWNVEGRELTWITPEHCMVLAGYSRDFIWVADPTYGQLRIYSIPSFLVNYNALYRQAVVIQ